MQNVIYGLAVNFDVTVIGPRGCREYLPPHLKVIEIHPSLGGFLFFSLFYGFKHALILKPSIIIGGSGLQSPLLLLLQTVFRIDSMVFIHGLDVVVNNAMYQALFIPCLRGIRKIIANSHNTMNLAVNRGIPRQRITIIHPGTDLPKLDRRSARRRFKDAYNVEADNILLFVGRLTPRKGLLGFVRESLPQILQQCSSCCLAVIGEHPVNSLDKRGPEVASIVEYVNRHRIADKILFLGHVENEALNEAYAAADLLVFPLMETSGDVEGFGMVAIEAAACGTPTVAFAVGGIVDAVDDARSGYLVEPKNYESFNKYVLDILSTKGTYTASCLAFAGNFTWNAYHKKLKRVIDSA